MGQKIAMGLIGVGLFTSAVLPKRQTVAVIGALDKLARGVLGTVMGTAKPA